MLSSVFLFSLVLTAVCAEPHGHSHLNRHHALAKRAAQDIQPIEKRESYSNARLTYYDAGQYEHPVEIKHVTRTNLHFYTEVHVAKPIRPVTL